MKTVLNNETELNVSLKIDPETGVIMHAVISCHDHDQIKLLEIVEYIRKKLVEKFAGSL